MFTGSAGQIVRLAVADTQNGPFFPEADLVAPGGAMLQTVQSGSQSQVTLTVGGSYSINVHDNNLLETGNYVIQLEGISPANPSAVSIKSGTDDTGNLVTGQVDEYKFTGAAGDSVVVSMGDTQNGPYFPIADVLSTSGIVASVQSGAQSTVKLPSSGTVLIQVHDNNFLEAGAYGFTVESLKLPSAGALSMVPDQSVQGQISKPGQVLFYSFFGNANDSINLALADSQNGPFFPTADIFDSSSTAIGSVSSGGQNSFKLSSSGLYFIAVHDNNFLESGSTGATLSWVSPLDGSISGNVFKDTNSNGKRDTGEAAMQGVTVYLDANGNGKLDAGERSTVSDALGNYSFTGLSAPTYSVREAVPSGMVITAPASGVYSVPVSLLQDVTGKSFGNATSAPVGSIAGDVFSDSNANGKLDTGEKRLTGVTVFLDANKNGKLDSGETKLTTDSQGNFKFTGLVPGTYRVMEVVPTGYKPIAPASGHFDETVSSGGAITGLLFADAPATASISGRVFGDSNGDGTRNPGEVGLGLWQVFIDYNNDGKIDGNDVSVTTSVNGNWSFTGLVAGTYTVRVVQVAGTVATKPTGGVLTIKLTAGQASIGNLFGEKSIN